MVLGFICLEPCIRQESIQARKGSVSTPAWPMPPRANVWAKRCIVALVSAACPIQICWLSHPCRCGPGCIDKIGRDIPPFDVKIGMRAVIGGKGKCLAGPHLRIIGGLAAEARKALRCGCPAGEGEKSNAARKCAPRQLWLSAHWQRS